MVLWRPGSRRCRRGRLRLWEIFRTYQRAVTPGDCAPHPDSRPNPFLGPPPSLAACHDHGHTCRAVSSPSSGYDGDSGSLVLADTIAPIRKSGRDWVCPIGRQWARQTAASQWALIVSELVNTPIGVLTWDTIDPEYPLRLGFSVKWISAVVVTDWPFGPGALHTSRPPITCPVRCQETTRQWSPGL